MVIKVWDAPLQEYRQVDMLGNPRFKMWTMKYKYAHLCRLFRRHPIQFKQGYEERETLVKNRLRRAGCYLHGRNYKY